MAKARTDTATPSSLNQRSYRGKPPGLCGGIVVFSRYQSMGAIKVLAANRQRIKGGKTSLSIGQTVIHSNYFEN